MSVRVGIGIGRPQTGDLLTGGGAWNVGALKKGHRAQGVQDLHGHDGPEHEHGEDEDEAVQDRPHRRGGLIDSAVYTAVSDSRSGL